MCVTYKKIKMKEKEIEANDEKVAYRGILIVTICEVLAILFFYAINR